METVKTPVSMSQVNNIETILTLSMSFWFLMIKFEQVWNIILLNLKKKFLLQILKKILNTFGTFLKVQKWQPQLIIMEKTPWIMIDVFRNQ